MAKEIPDIQPVNGTRWRYYDMATARVGNGICNFKRQEWGGNSCDSCSGTGSCDVLRRMGLQNLRGE